MIGLLVVQTLLRAGCGRVIAIDIDQERLAPAHRLGAVEALEAGEVAARRVREMTDGRGAEAVFEVVGNSAALTTALACVRKGGSLTLVGNLSPVVDLGLQSVVTREITVRSSCASCWEYPACLGIIERNEVDLSQLITAVAPLEEGAQWFRRLHDREKGLIKAILTPK